MTAWGQPGGCGGVTLLIVVPMWLAGCGGSTLGDARSCRTYASAYTHKTAMGVPLNVTCRHADDGAGFDRTCTGEFPTIEHWTSRADFIDEAAAVGVVRLATFTNTQLEITNTYEYDSERRLQHLVSSPEGDDETIDAWDELGRPLHRLTHAGACPGADITFSYGDRTITSDVPAGNPCNWHTVETFDADGIPTMYEHSFGTGDLYVDVYGTMARTTVCR